MTCFHLFWQRKTKWTIKNKEDLRVLNVAMKGNKKGCVFSWVISGLKKIKYYHSSANIMITRSSSEMYFKFWRSFKYEGSIGY